METTIKRGPIAKYDFTSYNIGDEIILEPLKQSSFKSMLSKFNKDIAPELRHKYQYEQIKRVIIAVRVK